MKTLLAVTLVISTFGTSTLAQQVDYNKIILPEGALDVSFEERLVQLAWQNNPAASMVKKDAEIANYDAKTVSARWSAIMGAQGNLNEFTIKQITGNDENVPNYFYPRYNFYLNIPLSLFVEYPQAKRSAWAKVELAEERVGLYKLELRARVLKLYRDYRMYEEIWNIRTTALQDEDSNYQLMEERFKSGNVAVEEYINAQKARNELKIQKIQAEADYLKAKYDLESMIGVKLEDVQ